MKFDFSQNIRHHNTWNEYGNVEADVMAINSVLSDYGAQVDDLSTGVRTVQYRATLTPSAPVKKLLALRDALQIALRDDTTRIFRHENQLVIEKKGAINCVCLGDLYTDYFKDHPGLPIMLGMDSTGRRIFTDLLKAPHMLVAGCTGGGKSMFLHSVICSLLMKNPRIEIYAVDPKKVEFQSYSPLKNFHVSDNGLTYLNYLVGEMERRYSDFASKGYRDFASAKAAGENIEPIVLIIDELSDLMETARQEAESLIVRLAQKARAAGIHLVIATQYPIVKNCTGLIKANIPVRAAFRTTSVTESRVILDRKGAEELLGNGDMLFLGKGELEPMRIQSCLIDKKEMNSVAWQVQQYQKALEPEITYPKFTTQPKKRTFLQKLFGVA